MRKVVTPLADPSFDNADDIRLEVFALAYTIKQATLSTIGSIEIWIINFVGPMSSIMVVLTSKRRESSWYFDESNENAARNVISSLKQILGKNQTVDGNKWKINGQLLFEPIFRICTTFKKITSGLGLHITVKRADLQDIVYTTKANAFLVTIEILYLFVPIYKKNTETQVTLSESIKNTSN